MPFLKDVIAAVNQFVHPNQYKQLEFSNGYQGPTDAEKAEAELKIADQHAQKICSYLTLLTKEIEAYKPDNSSMNQSLKDLFGQGLQPSLEQLQASYKTLQAELQVQLANIEQIKTRLPSESTNLDENRRTSLNSPFKNGKND